MRLNNPLRPGSVTTDILHDGAVTCVKTDFSSCTLDVHLLTIDGATPSLIGGSNIAITGTWPNQTVALSNYIKISADGASIEINGTGTGEKATFLQFEANSTIWFEFATDYNFNNTQNIRLYDHVNSKVVFAYDNTNGLTLGTPLAISQGGTGTSSPSLVAGSNITITGSWPNQTIALANELNLVRSQPFINLNDTGNVTEHSIIRFQSGGNGQFAIVNYEHSSGNPTLEFYNYNTASSNIIIDINGLIRIEKNISRYNGVSTVGVGVPSIIAKADVLNQSSGTSGNTLYTVPSGGGAYRVSMHMRFHSSTPLSGTDALFVTYVSGGVTFNLNAPNLNVSSQTDAAVDLVGMIYCDGGSNIQWGLSKDIAGGSDDIHIRVESI